MRSLKATVILEQDGVEVERLVRRISVDEVQAFHYEKLTGAGFVTLPIGEVSDLQLILVQAVDQDVTLRLDGQSDAGLVVKAGGFLLLVDTDVDANPATNVTVENTSGATALLEGLVGGT